MPYLDGTEEPPPAQPKFCPLCSGSVVTKWHAILQHRVRIGYFAVAVPAHVCTKCGIAIRVHGLPDFPPYKTRKAARASRTAEAATKNDESRAYRMSAYGRLQR